jgi:hypothetical protein
MANSYAKFIHWREVIRGFELSALRLGTFHSPDSNSGAWSSTRKRERNVTKILEFARELSWRLPFQGSAIPAESVPK